MSAAYDARSGRPGGRSRNTAISGGVIEKNPFDNEESKTIWQSRHVEMPIPSAISQNHIASLYKSSRDAGSSLGIVQESSN